MTVKQFRTLARKKGAYETIPVNLIRIVSDIHKGKANFSTILALRKSRDKLLVIVHKNNDGTYNLITGWKDYLIAMRDDIEEIKAVLVNETTREEFLHNMSSKIWLNLKDISIPKCFLSHPPKKEKLKIYKLEIINAVNNGCLSDYLNEKPIIINKDNVLIDGYARYIVLKRLNYERKIPIIRKDL